MVWLFSVLRAFDSYLPPLLGRSALERKERDSAEHQLRKTKNGILWQGNLIARFVWLRYIHTNILQTIFDSF